MYGEIVKQQISEQWAAKQQTAEQWAAKQQTVEQQTAEQQTAEQQAVEQQTAEQQISEQQTAEQQIFEQQTIEQQTIEQQIVEQLAVENQWRTLGIRMGKYILIRSLGQGGEGSVYLARDEHLQRYVAIKCIRRMEADKSDADKEEESMERIHDSFGLIDQEYHENRLVKNSHDHNNRNNLDESGQNQEREVCQDKKNYNSMSFQDEICLNNDSRDYRKRKDYGKKEEKIMREANYLQRLEHPMLPVVYDLFEDTGGEWYLVMEYIQGVNLHEYIERNGCVQDGQARVWAEQLADVLGYFHSRKPPVIYIDLKPDNIMVCPGGKLRLVDFGAALTRSFGADRRIRMAATPGYGAPEQWGAINVMTQNTRQGYMRGDFYADERSDIYALGKVLYYMVTGADPAKPPYTALPIYEYQPLLGDDLEIIIRKCIRQEPERRYQTVEEVRRDLRRSVGRRQRARRKDFIRMVEKRVWLTEGETMVWPGSVSVKD